MTKKMGIVFPVVLLLMAGMCVTVLSCGGDSEPKIDTFTGKDNAGKEYKLEIIDNSTYRFYIDGTQIGTGTAAKNGDVWTLTQNGEGGGPLTVTVDSSTGQIMKIEGIIYPDDNSGPITPGQIVNPKPIAGVWTWSTSDDSKTNESKGATQSVFVPGGASRINNVVENTESPGNYQPFKYAEADKPKDKDGNAIEGDVFNFKGVTKVTSNGRTQDVGARFPMVGWEAVPDEATLALLKTAYSYSFWVRLNSATASNWSFLTAVVTDFTPEEGYEYKHWFGNKPGDSGGDAKINNYTNNLTVGTWYQIKVVMKRTATGFNMYQDKWIWAYDSGIPARGEFNQNKAEKIQWQIPLQHQVGAGVKTRGGDPYDVTEGSYDFDFDFYGLEFIQQ